MAGRLIYLIGPSGSGKDSLLDAAREPLAQCDCRIVRRVITRSAEAIGEAAHGVSAEQFATMQAQGAFALSWKANGLSYGIPIDIEQWLAAGQDVLVNGSRGYLPQARERYPELLAGYYASVCWRAVASRCRRSRRAWNVTRSSPSAKAPWRRTVRRWYCWTTPVRSGKR